MARLATAVAGHIMVPLNVATKEDVQAVAQEVKGLKDKVDALGREVKYMRRNLEHLSLSLEEARLIVGRALERLGFAAECRDFRTEEMEWDGLCVAGDLAVLVEAKVRSSSAQVERTAHRLRELLTSPPPELRDRRVVAAHYAMRYADEGEATNVARRYGVWVFKDGEELTRPEELTSHRRDRPNPR